MTEITPQEIETKVLDALSQIRPFLNEDGGDIDLLEITSDNIVKLAFTGACSACTMNNMTFKAGVEEAIKRNVPQVKSVEAINLFQS